MVKMMIFLCRAEHLDRAAFAEWWLGRHRPLAERLPGLRRHGFNLLPEGAPFDAVVEQWFDSKEAALGCYETFEGRAVVEDSAANVRFRVRVEAEEHDFRLAAAAAS